MGTKLPVFFEYLVKRAKVANKNIKNSYDLMCGVRFKYDDESSDYFLPNKYRFMYPDKNIIIKYDDEGNIVEVDDNLIVKYADDDCIIAKYGDKDLNFWYHDNCFIMKHDDEGLSVTVDDKGIMYIHSDNGDEITINEIEIDDGEISETKVVLDIACNPKLNHLLKHRLVSFFLDRKWCKIKHILYTYIAFYMIFHILLCVYIRTYKSTLSIPCYLLWFFVTLLWLLITILEILLFACCSCRYLLMNWKNWLRVVLIIFTPFLLFDAGAWSYVVVDLLSALVLTTLISHHPKISINIEMFWIICRKCVCLLLSYSFLIAAFGLTFYILFGNNKHFFNLGDTFFKTLIMVFISEFNTNDIPVDSHPVLSPIVLVLFAFFIFVLGKVSNTEEIRSEAELNGLKSRLRLIVYLENIAYGEPFTWLNWFSRGNLCLLRWKPFSFLINRIVEVTYYSQFFSNNFMNIKLCVCYKMDSNTPKNTEEVRMIFCRHEVCNNIQNLKVFPREYECIYMEDVKTGHRISNTRQAYAYSDLVRCVSNAALRGCIRGARY
ncbi:uncharacterized protein LOC112456888 [Temnothorax curvispinosus]|uniref:Uncharacterized protein LOC112456888 n=1 Tax=Temnothorax curvispinosus TaxID=300111 RepID=A0A6J1Q1C6_9HYME|nr:uncharacterized protein LOC112456888 [Temnothorax curvispinosus]